MGTNCALLSGNALAKSLLIMCTEFVHVRIIWLFEAKKCSLWIVLYLLKIYKIELALISTYGGDSHLEKFCLSRTEHEEKFYHFREIKFASFSCLGEKF